MKYLALGDSYTIGEGVRETERWPVQLVGELSRHGVAFEPPQIIAVTGWRTDQLRQAIESQKPGKDFDLVSLLIGVNNQYQGKDVDAYEVEFRELLTIAIGHAGGRKERVFILSIPDYGFTPFGNDKQESISTQIDRFNKANRNIADELGVSYFDITEISRQGLNDASLLAADGLHPSGKMYRHWVDLIMTDFTPLRSLINR